MPAEHIDLTGPIINELYETLRKCGADASVLEIVGSWQDTQPDHWVLESLEEWNGRKLLWRERFRQAWRVLRQKPAQEFEISPAVMLALEDIARKANGEARQARGVHVDPD